MSQSILAWWWVCPYENPCFGLSASRAGLEDRRKEIEAAVPRLEAEVDILKVNNLSAEEIAAQASSLYDHWQTMQPEEKRELVEVITDKIVIGKDEITINLCYAPSSKDMATRWRKGWDSCPKLPLSVCNLPDFPNKSSIIRNYLG